MQSAARIENCYGPRGGFDLRRNRDRVAFGERDLRGIDGETVKGRSIQRSEAFKSVQRIGFFKDFGKTRNRDGCRKASRTSASVFFRVCRVGRAVSPKEKACFT